MQLLWESELVQQTAPLGVEVLPQVSGAAKLLTQTCRNKQTWEILSICSRTTGLSLLPRAWAAPAGHPRGFGQCRGRRGEPQHEALRAEH